MRDSGLGVLLFSELEEVKNSCQIRQEFRKLLLPEIINKLIGINV